MNEVTQMDILLAAVFAGISFLGLASLAWGVDSRPGFTDPRLSGRFF
jgi:hypothetical protein